MIRSLIENHFYKIQNKKNVYIYIYIEKKDKIWINLKDLILIQIIYELTRNNKRIRIVADRNDPTFFDQFNSCTKKPTQLQYNNTKSKLYRKIKRPSNGSLNSHLLEIPQRLSDPPASFAESLNHPRGR